MIEVKNLTKTYNIGKKNAFTALSEVSFTVDDGEMVAITGKSGAGKSTLLHIMGAIDDFEQGSVTIGDTELSSLSESALADIRNTKVGIVMQDFVLIEDYSVVENITLPLYFCKTKRKERIKRAAAAMEATGISELKDKIVKQLSGGQKQRVAIARAVVTDPDFVLADEPTGALDTKTGAEIMNLFKKLNADGKTVIIITHDMSIANQCGRKIEICDGRILD